LLTLAFMTALAWRSSLRMRPQHAGQSRNRSFDASLRARRPRQQAAAQLARECTSSAACDQPRGPVKAVCASPAPWSSVAEREAPDEGEVRFEEVKVRPNRIGTSQCKFLETALRFYPVEQFSLVEVDG